MATLAQIRAGLTKTLAQGVTSVPGLFVYGAASDASNLPAVVVVPMMYAPEDGNSTYSSQHSMLRWTFRLYVMCSRADTETGQAQLDTLLSGPGSITQALWDNDELYCDDSTTVTWTSMNGYGGHGQDAKIPIIGAVMEVQVMTDPRRH